MRVPKLTSLQIEEYKGSSLVGLSHTSIRLDFDDDTHFDMPLPSLSKHCVAVALQDIGAVIRNKLREEGNNDN